jgi:hypothetical protein
MEEKREEERVEAFSLMWDRIRADRAVKRAEYCRLGLGLGLGLELEFSYVG